MHDPVTQLIRLLMLFRYLTILLTIFCHETEGSEKIGNKKGTLSFKLSPTALKHRYLEQSSYVHHENIAAVYAGIDHLRLVSNFENERKQSRYSRRRHLQEDIEEVKHGGSFESFQTAPLSQGVGTHYATVWVGTPSQPQTVIVDTGSHLTAFPCEPCSACGEGYHASGYFNPKLSSTFEWNTCAQCSDTAKCSGGQCHLRQSYAEGSSWNAIEGRDMFFVGFNHPSEVSIGPQRYDESKLDKEFGINFSFGCQNHLTGLFIKQLADGIMGMGVSDVILPVQMMKQGILEHSIFSMCFARKARHEKGGITAGILTLGGMNPILQKSPMVFAKMGDKTRGWYNLSTKKILLRKGGGNSAKEPFLDRKENLFLISDDIHVLNSGSGLIVDSGTTDTYLPSSLQHAFKSAYKKITGREYSNDPVHLTFEEVLKLPTILIVVEPFDPEANEFDPETTVGLAGKIISPASPTDVVIAIPASHYMEYTPSSNTYIPRVYLSERSGGVLGANTMMSHDIVFDAENRRIGFAESDCNYDELVIDAELINPEESNGSAGEEDGERPRCKVGEPSMSLSCVESIDVAQCFADGASGNLLLKGHIKYTSIIEDQGFVNHGADCESVALEPFISQDIPSRAICEDDGICTVLVSCEMTCEDIKIKVQEEEDNEVLGEGEFDPNGNKSDFGCSSDGWGACLSSCKQSRIISTKELDGKCHVTGEETRDCHIDACGKDDPCRIPFLVHAIVGLDIEAEAWYKVEEDIFIDSFVSTVNADREQTDILFSGGDVKILSVGKWLEDDPSVEAVEKGVKVILEISLFNENAILSPQKKSNMGKTFFSLGSKPELAICSETDIYALSSRAMSVHKELERTNFIIDLIRSIQNQKESELESSAFFGLDLDGESDVLSSWTVKTEVKDASIHFDQETVKQNFPFVLGIFFLLLSICVAGICCGSACAQRRYSKLLLAKDKLMERRKERIAQKEKGEYAAVGIEASDFDDDLRLEIEDGFDEFENNP